MTQATEKVCNRLDDIIGLFLSTQLGENPDSVSSHLNDDIVAVYAHDVISPAEKAMMQGERDHRFLLEYKVKQFESVKQDLCKPVKEILGKEVAQIHSTVTEDGIRIITIRMG